MNIYDKLNEISRKFKENEKKLKEARKLLKNYTKDKKRAKIETSKDSIQQENIEPLRKHITSLKIKSEELEMQLLAIESHVLEEELKTRQNGTTTVTKLDNKYRLKFLFTKFRRFGNFTGYLSGRKEEADNTIKNFLIKKEVQGYIRSVGADNLYAQFEIDPNSRGAYTDLIHSVIENHLIDFEDLDARLSMFKSRIVNPEVVVDSADRKKMLKSLQENVSKKAPSTPLLDLVNEPDEIGDDSETR